MKRFKVKLHGENFLLDFDGEPKKFGFYATTFIKAKNPQDAEKIAIILIRQDLYLRNIVLKNGSADRPTIHMEELKKVNLPIFFSKKLTRGFTFYCEDEE